MKNTYLSIITLLCLVVTSNFAFGQVTTIDFETAGAGYTPSATSGSGFTDVFNRTKPNIGGNSTYMWSVEDISLFNPYINLTQIDITGSTAFDFDIDMLAHHYNDWDNSDYLRIYYSIDGGSYQNLMWVQNAGGTYNQAASLDTDFDNVGDCGSGILGALTTGTSGCTVSSNTFSTFSSPTITLSGNTTLDIRLEFTGFTANDEGIYLDNIVITETVAATNDTDSEIYDTGLQPAAATISSTDDTPAEAINVFDFTIEDMASGDGLATSVTNVRLQPHTTNNADWTDHIGGVLLKQGATTLTTGAVTITDTEINIPISAGNLDIADGTSEDVEVYIYLNTSNIVDGAIFSCYIDETTHGFTADAAGSDFSSSLLLGDFNSNDFTIDIDATELAIIQQPTDVAINTAMSPSVTVAYVDEHGQIDEDYDGAGFEIGIASSSLTLVTSTSVAPVNGVATFSAIEYTAGGTNEVLTFTDVNGWMSPPNDEVDSDPFDVTAPPANDDCANDSTLTVGAPAVSGTLVNATPTSGNSFSYQSAANDVWYSFTPTCTGNHTITLNFFKPGSEDVELDIFSSVCPTTGSASYTSHGSSSTETITASFTGGTTYSIRVFDYNNSGATTFDIGITTTATPEVTLSNTGSPSSQTIVAPATAEVLYGFELTPNGCVTTYDFTNITITNPGTASNTELGNLYLVYDADNSGTVNGAEASVSNTIIGVSGSLMFTLSGQTGLSTARSYLLVGDVYTSTPGTTTFTASADATDVTATVTVTGSASGNTQTLLTVKPEPTNHPTLFSCGTTTTSTIPLTWTDATGTTTPDGYLIKWSTGSNTPPVDGTAEADGAGVQNVLYGVETLNVTGLTQGTTYNFSIWAYTNSGSAIDYKLIGEASTSCATQTGPCLGEESFESSSNPSGWSNNGSYYNTGSARTGSYKAGMNDVSDWIQLPDVDNPSSLEYYARLSSSPTGTNSVKVQYNNSGTWTDIVTHTATTTSYVLFTADLSSLTSLTNVQLRLYRSADNRSHYIDDLSVYCGSPASEIDVQGNYVSIADGDNTPSPSDYTDFGSTEVTSGTITRLFQIKNLGGADLSLTNGISPYVSISGTNAADFTITTIPDTTIAAGDSTTLGVTFDPSGVGLRTATLSIDNDDSDENPYTFDIQGTGTNSSISDIIVSSGYTYQTNIDYTAFQRATPFTSATGSVGVFRFEIRDGGASAPDADSEDTELNAITFDVGTTHINYIRNAALFDGLSDVATSPTIDYFAGTISFTGLSGADFTATDDGTKTLTLRVSFTTTVTDNEKLIFTISSATANPSKSIFADADAGGAFSDNSAGNDRNRIEVTVSDLLFTQQPSDASVSQNMTPAVTVSGVDLYDNIDLDWSATVSIVSTGTLSSSPQTAVTSGGTATFSTINHTVSGTGFELTASATGLSDVTSSLFDITEFVYYAGDYRSTADYTDFSWNNTTGLTNYWEYYDGTSWGPTPGDKGPENAAITPTRIIIDNVGVSAGGSSSNTYNDIIVLQNAELYIVDVDLPPVAAEFIGSSDKLEILEGAKLFIEGDIDLASTADFILRDGAEMIIDHDNITNDHPMWDGDELFEGGSTVEIRDWDFSASATVRSLINITSTISDNANGYKFGNIYFNPDSGNQTDHWTIVGGSLAVGLGVTENDFIINNSSSYFVLGMSNRQSGISCIFGGDVIVEDGDFSFGGSFTTDNFDQTITVKGDVEILSNDDFYIHHAFSGTPTITAGNSPLILEGDLTVGASVNIVDSDVTTKEVLFTGDVNHIINIEPNVSSTPFILETGDSAILDSTHLKLAGNSSFEIEGDATFNFGFDRAGTTALEIQDVAGSNEFDMKSGAYLFITHPQGIWDASANGNVQNFVSSLTNYAQTNSTFHYIGREDQETGDAFTSGSTAKTIICELEDSTDELTVTSTTGTSVILDIKKGIVVNTDANYIYGTGDLTITNGGLRTSVLTGTSTVPTLTGTYSLTGGFVELNANGDQTLRGARDYYDLIISGSNTSGVNDKTPTSAFTVANNLQITGTPIFDIANDAMTGTAGITMDGGLLRISKLYDTTPELLGTATPYDITGGTVEWYGSNATQFQNIRGSYVPSLSTVTISYHNIEVNASAANTNDFNVGLSASIELTGEMNINSPAVFQTDQDDHIDGTGDFNVLAGATYKYGDEYGITLGTSTSLTAGAIRVSSNRTIANFPTSASYGFVGGTDMVTGNGLPTQAVNIYLDKSLQDNMVTLTNDLSISGTLDMEQGNILTTSSNLLELGTSTATLGNLDYDDTFEPFVIGRMKRWFNTATNTGNASGLFPLGDTTNATANDVYNRFAKVEYSSAKTSGGSLTARFVNVPMSYLGLNIYNVSAVGSCPAFDVTSTEDQGYWRIDDGDGLTGGNYDITCTGEGFDNISDLCQITLLKRVGGGVWFENGNHLEPFYLNGNSAQPTVTRQGASGWSNYGFGGGEANLLPIELLTFTAEHQNGNAQLDWATASELNNDYFEVEHSLDAIYFSKIGEVEGNGTTNSESNYDFTHIAPPAGINYYRLRQIDYSGDFAYSGVRAVIVDNSGENSMYVINTLAQNDLILQFLSTNSRKGNLVIYSSNGQIMMNRALNLASGGTQLSIDVSQFPSALYVVQWYSGDQIIEEKFIKKY